MGSAASIATDEDASLLKIATLKDLPDAMDVACFQFERHPLILDDSQGNGERFLRYQGSVLYVDRKEDMEPDRLRTCFLGCLKAGSILTISFGDSPVDLSKIPTSESHFPEQLLDRRSCLDQNVWRKLLRDSDPKADRFALEIRGTMTLCCVTRNKDISEDLYRVMKVIQVGKKSEEEETEKQDEIDNMFGLTKEIIRNSADMAEFAFDGDFEEVKALLEKGFHIDSVEENDHSALSEASCTGQTDLVKFLLEQGADPNHDGRFCCVTIIVMIIIIIIINHTNAYTHIYAAPNGDGKTPLYRAAFNGHVETVRLLLEAGADPDRTCAKVEEGTIKLYLV